MATQTMTEKDWFLKKWDDEFQITRRVLAAVPHGKEDFKPAEKSRALKDLAFIFMGEEKVIEGAMSPGFMPQGPPPTPAVPVAELLKIYEQSHPQVFEKVKALPPDAFDRVMKFPVGPGQMADVRYADVCWLMLNDAVHHRGQLSVYIRMVGGVVPPIYGPTLEVPWF